MPDFNLGGPPMFSLDTGGYEGPAAFPWQAAEAIINTAWNLAVSGLEAAGTKMAALDASISSVSAGTVAADDITAGTVATPTVVEPTVTIPASVDVGDITAVYDTKMAELIAELASRFTAFLGTHFPTESAVYGQAQTALASLMDGELPAGLGEALMAEDRVKALQDASRATNTVLAKFASMRYPLPPGAAAAAALQTQQQANDTAAESRRKYHAKMVDVVQAAVAETLKLRKDALDAGINYIKALVAGPENAAKLVGVGYDAQSKLISSVSSFYGQRVAFAELLSKVGQFNVSSALDADAKNQSASLEAAIKNQTAALTAALGVLAERVKVGVADADMTTKASTALFNNINVTAGGHGNSNDSFTKTMDVTP